MVRKSERGSEHLAVTQPWRVYCILPFVIEWRIALSVVCYEPEYTTKKQKCFSNLTEAVEGSLSLVWNVPL